GERIAQLPIAQCELAFVIGTPNVVGSRDRTKRLRARRRMPAPSPRLDQAVALEHIAYRTGRRPVLSRLFTAQPVAQRNRSPARMPDRKSTRLNSSHVSISYAV